MFSNISSVSRIARRFVASVPSGGFKVAVLGAAGGIGQPLSMLLKLDHNVQELALFDIVNTPGVEADISHISSNAKTRSFLGPEQLQAALTGMDVVIIPAGVPRKPGMTRDDLFNTNAKIVMTLAQACAKHCPKAHFLVIANPVNSTVPIFGEVLKAAGVYNPRHLFGVTTLDVVRAKTFVAAHQKWDVNQTNVDVIGGHAGTTIIPLLSQLPTKFSESDLDGLVKRIQFGGDEVVNAKNGAGSATLSMAYAGAHFTSRLLKALRGDANIKECAFVESSVTAASYFSSPVTLGKDGVDTVHKYGQLSPREQSNLTEMLPQLIAQIEKGIKFAKDNK